MEAKTPRQKGFFQSNNSSLSSPITSTATLSSPASEPVEVSQSGASKGYFKTGEKEETSGNALLGLLVYSFMILFAPIFVFFGAKQALEDNGYEPPTTTIAPAIMAIACVNIVIVLYVIKAFREENISSENSKNKSE